MQQRRKSEINSVFWTEFSAFARDVVPKISVGRELKYEVNPADT